MDNRNFQAVKFPACLKTGAHTVLIKAGSEGHHSPVMTGEGQEEKGEGEAGEGRGIPFVNSSSPGSASPSALLRGCLWGKVHFRDLRKWIVRTLLWAAGGNSRMGRAAWGSFKLLEGLLFKSAGLIHEQLDYFLSGVSAEVFNFKMFSRHSDRNFVLCLD